MFDMSFKEMLSDTTKRRFAAVFFGVCALSAVFWILFAAPQAAGMGKLRLIAVAGFPAGLFILLGFSAVNDFYSGNCIRHFLTYGLILYAAACVCEAIATGGWAAPFGKFFLTGLPAYAWILSRPILALMGCALAILAVETLEHLLVRDLAGAGDIKALTLLFCLPLHPADCCAAAVAGLFAAILQCAVMRTTAIRALPAISSVAALTATILMRVHGLAL